MSIFSVIAAYFCTIKCCQLKQGKKIYFVLFYNNHKLHCMLVTPHYCNNINPSQMRFCCLKKYSISVSLFFLLLSIYLIYLKGCVHISGFIKKKEEKSNDKTLNLYQLNSNSLSWTLSWSLVSWCLCRSMNSYVLTGNKKQTEEE